MARPRSKHSTLPFAGIGLERHEEEELKNQLQVKDISYRSLQRTLVRAWLAEQRKGANRFALKP